MCLKPLFSWRGTKNPSTSTFRSRSVECLSRQVNRSTSPYFGASDIKVPSTHLYPHSTGSIEAHQSLDELSDEGHGGKVAKSPKTNVIKQLTSKLFTRKKRINKGTTTIVLGETVTSLANISSALLESPYSSNRNINSQSRDTENERMSAIHLSISTGSIESNPSVVLRQTQPKSFENELPATAPRASEQQPLSSMDTQWTTDSKFVAFPVGDDPMTSALNYPTTRSYLSSFSEEVDSGFISSQSRADSFISHDVEPLDCHYPTTIAELKRSSALHYPQLPEIDSEPGEGSETIDHRFLSDRSNADSLSNVDEIIPFETNEQQASRPANYACITGIAETDVPHQRSAGESMVPQLCSPNVSEPPIKETSTPTHRNSLPPMKGQNTLMTTFETNIDDPAAFQKPDIVPVICMPMKTVSNNVTGPDITNVGDPSAFQKPDIVPTDNISSNSLGPDIICVSTGRVIPPTEMVLNVTTNMLNDDVAQRLVSVPVESNPSRYENHEEWSHSKSTLPSSNVTNNTDFVEQDIEKNTGKFTLQSSQPIDPICVYPSGSMPAGEVTRDISNVDCVSSDLQPWTASPWHRKVLAWFGKKNNTDLMNVSIKEEIDEDVSEPVANSHTYATPLPSASGAQSSLSPLAVELTDRHYLVKDDQQLHQHSDVILASNIDSNHWPSPDIELLCLWSMDILVAAANLTTAYLPRHLYWLFVSNQMPRPSSTLTVKATNRWSDYCGGFLRHPAGVVTVIAGASLMFPTLQALPAAISTLTSSSFSSATILSLLQAPQQHFSFRFGSMVSQIHRPSFWTGSAVMTSFAPGWFTAKSI